MANPQEVEAFAKLMQTRQSINEMVMSASDLNSIKTELMFEENKQFMAIQRFCILQQQHYDASGGKLSVRRFLREGTMTVLWVLFTVLLILATFYVITNLPSDFYARVLGVLKAKLPGGMGS